MVFEGFAVGADCVFGGVDRLEVEVVEGELERTSLGYGRCQKGVNVTIRGTIGGICCVFTSGYRNLDSSYV